MQTIKLPALFLNFKTYEEATAEKALQLAKIAEKISNEYNATIVVVAQATDIRLIASSVNIPVFAQHIDNIKFGSNTGKILPEAVKAAGAIGTILNHAENKQTNEFIQEALERAEEVGLITMVCAETTERAKQIASMKIKPELIAIEPPELIGGNISVSSAKPEFITNAIKEIHKIAKIPVVAGAGIKTKEDVRKALQLGCKGVFVASGVVKAEDKEEAIKELVAPFSEFEF